MPYYEVTIVNYHSCVVAASDEATARAWAENRKDDNLFYDTKSGALHAVEEAGAGVRPAATVTADGKHEWTWGID